jgi:hypothetical protein
MRRRADTGSACAGEIRHTPNLTGQHPPRLGGGSVAPDCSPEQYLASENNALRKAGCKLAEAALYVAREYDGVHRLMLAVAEWAKAVADEGGRGRANPCVLPPAAPAGRERGGAQSSDVAKQEEQDHA